MLAYDNKFIYTWAGAHNEYKLVGVYTPFVFTQYALVTWE